MKKLILLALFSLTASVPAHAEVSRTITYEVPTTSELAPFARFEIPYDGYETPDGDVTVTYTLPATLLGQERTFHLEGRGSAGAYALRGADADMGCVEGRDTVTCRVTHHNVTIDVDGVKSALEKTTMTSQEKQGHLALAASLAREGGDLVGVFAVRKSR